MSTDIAIFLLIGICLETYLLYKQRSKIASLKGDNALLVEKIDAIQAKMPPHFMCNVLNSISALMLLDVKKAEEILDKFSELLHGVFYAIKLKTHSLTREIEICKNYIEIEKVRFEKRLQAELEADINIDLDNIHIPVFTIHTIIEHCVRSAIADDSKGGRVYVDIRQVNNGIAVVVDSFDFREESYNEARHEFGKKLKRCRARLKAHYARDDLINIREYEDGHRVTSILFPLPC